MRKIRKAFSHIELEKKNTSKVKPIWKEKSKNEDILLSEPLKIESYRDLVESVAQISFYNRDHNLFFRGQSEDYKDKGGKTTIFPSIYRTNKNGEHIVSRFDELEESTNKLMESFQRDPNRFAGTSNVIKYKELRWAIAQHYNITDTPVLDLTHSLHVAASFALKDLQEGEYGVVQIIGLPNYTNTISYFTNEELAIIRLIAFGPPKASRIFMQEAYAVSPFPFTDLVRKVGIEKFNFSRRLIAKFAIPKDSEFWGEGFSPIPDRLLIPDVDKFKDFLAPHLINVDAFFDYFSTNK